MSVIRFLGEKPAPSDPITIAIIAKQGSSYDDEAVGEEIWGEPDDVEEGEEYESLVSCMWPACTLLGFESISNELLDTMNPLDMKKLIDELGVQSLELDLAKLDHLFHVADDGSFTEITPVEALGFSNGYTIEFIEYEST